MKKIFYFLSALILLAPTLALAVQITVPSAPNSGYVLLSGTSGTYTPILGSAIFSKPIIANYPLSFDAPTGNLSVGYASPFDDGVISSTDYQTFNNKLDSLFIGLIVSGGFKNTVLFKDNNGELNSRANFSYLTSNGTMGIGTTTPAGILDLASTSGNLASLVINQGISPTGSATTTGSIWNSATQNAFQWFNGLIETPRRTVYTMVTDGIVKNTVTETSITGTGVGTTTIPANWWKVGKTIAITGQFVYQATGIGPTATVKIKAGSTIIAQGTAGTLLNTGTNNGGTFTFQVTCQSISSNNCIFSGGGSVSFTSGAVGTRGFADLVTNTVSDPINVAKIWDVTVTWSAASAGNAATSTTGIIDVLN